MDFVAIGVVATFFMVGVSAFTVQAQSPAEERELCADSLRASYPASTPSSVIG